MTGLNHLSKSWKAWRSSRRLLQAIVRLIPGVRQYFGFDIWYHRRSYSPEDRIKYSLANKCIHRDSFVASFSKSRWCQCYAGELKKKPPGYLLNVEVNVKWTSPKKNLKARKQKSSHRLQSYLGFSGWYRQMIRLKFMNLWLKIKWFYQIGSALREIRF